MERKLRVLMLLLMLASFPLLAQERTLTGKVTDEDGPMPGVNILVKGTTNGAVTDQNGTFKITVSESQGVDGILVFSFIGYMTEEVAISNRTAIDMRMMPDIMTLGEIVIVGYGHQQKKDVTGSLATVATESFNKGVISSPQDMLIGKVAGVQITTASGAPGSGASIRIRGNGSIQGSQEPLIVIDGFPVDASRIDGLANPLAALNPNDIESFTVLKDAAATAIFGLRASNGVIIITTKKGKEGKPQLSYNTNVSVSTPMKYIDVLSGDEMRVLADDLLEQNLSGLTSQAIQRLGDANTDWQKEIYRNAVSHDHNIGISGTYKNFPYRVTYGYTDQKGILKTTNFVRNSLNINFTPTFLDGNLKVTASLKGSHTKQNFGNTGAVGAAVAFDPTQPVYNGSTRWGGYFSWVSPASATTLDPNGDPITIATNNPVSLLMQTDNRSNVYRALGNIQFDYNLPFLPELKLTLNAGIDYASSEGHNNAPTDAAWTFANGGGQRIDYTGVNKSRLLDLYANYLKQIGKNKFDVTAGYSFQNFQRDGSNFGRNGQTGDATIFTDYQLRIKDGDTTEVARQYIPNPNTLISFFGRLNYTFDDRYLLTFSFRKEASSRFSGKNRFKTFPAVGLGWNLSKEDFLKSVTFLSSLKLRASYGITGQQEIAAQAYPYLPLYQLSSATSQYQFGNTFYNTYRPQRYDDDFRWETTAQTNIGLDFGFFDNRVTGAVEVYQRNTDDLINEIPVAAGSNFSNFLITNVGSMVNKGFEVTINAIPVRNDKLEWNIGFNYSHNENEVTKLLKTEDPNYPGIQIGGIGLQRYIQNIQVGYPINTYLVYKQVYDLQGNPVEGLYEDFSGLGGEVTASENNKYRYKTPQANHLIGINSRVSYKKFDFAFSARVSIGNYVYNNILAGANYSNFYYTTGYFNNLPKAVNDTKFFNLQAFSDYYIENASFLKMDNMSMGYNFDKVFTEKLKGRVSFTVQNAFFITKYSGIDPEVSGGIDNNIYPRPRVFMLGLNLTY